MLILLIYELIMSIFLILAGAFVGFEMVYKNKMSVIFNVTVAFLILLDNSLMPLLFTKAPVIFSDANGMLIGMVIANYIILRRDAKIYFYNRTH